MYDLGIGGQDLSDIFCCSGKRESAAIWCILSVLQLNLKVKLSEISNVHSNYDYEKKLIIKKLIIF